jgi:hypothetical protein
LTSANSYGIVKDSCYRLDPSKELVFDAVIMTKKLYVIGPVADILAAIGGWGRHSLPNEAD